MGYFIEIRYFGNNLECLINSAKKAGISVYKVRKIKDKEYLFRIKKRDETIFFANRALVCYNIKIEKTVGILSHFSAFFKNAGLVLGVIVFLTFSCFFSGVVLSIEFSGSGAVYGEKVLYLLEKNNLKKFSFPSEADMKNARKDIYESFDDFSFVSVSKRGTKITVNLVKAEESKRVIINKKSITSPCDGEIESIKLIGGTALFSVGDKVKKGDALVDGFKMIGEVRVETNAVAVITLIAFNEYVCDLSVDNKDSALLLITAENPDLDVIESFAEKISEENGIYKFKVSIKHRIEIR